MSREATNVRVRDERPDSAIIEEEEEEEESNLAAVTKWVQDGGSAH